MSTIKQKHSTLTTAEINLNIASSAYYYTYIFDMRVVLYTCVFLLTHRDDSSIQLCVINKDVNLSCAQLHKL